MRLSLTNLAWHPVDDERVAALLQRRGIDAIDIAPSKYFPDPTRATMAEVRALRQWWADRGIELVGMQSLLYGTQGLNLFGDASSQQRMLEHLRAVCAIGAESGATRLVFGSPANRVRGSLDARQAEPMAMEFLQRFADIAQAEGVLICLEPVVPYYRCDFINTTAECIDWVKRLAHPAVAITLDTANLQMNGEAIEEVLPNHAALVGHVHCCEKDLRPLIDDEDTHARMADAIRRHLPDHCVCIEILAPNQETSFADIERSLQIGQRHYQ